MASLCSSVEADMCNDPISQSLSVLVDPLRRGKIRYSGVVVGVSPEEVVTEGQSSPAISFRVKVAPLPIRCLLEVRIARALADVVVFHSAQVS
ncbi:unnamed protein product, partial [Brassica oleracea]